MTETVEWDIDTGGREAIQLELATSVIVRERSFLIGVRGCDAARFIEANQTWNFSDSLQMPFRYLTPSPLDGSPIDFGTVVFPADVDTITFVLAPWGKSLQPLPELATVLIVSSGERNEGILSEFMKGKVSA